MEPYPITFAVDYPDRALNRLSTFFRLFAAIPIWVILALLGNALTALWLPTMLMILFRKKYPRWWFDFGLEMRRFQNRVFAYLLLMDDRYPSTDEHQSVRLDYVYPDAERDLNRFLPLIKWLLILPHAIVLLVLYIGVWIAAIIAWFAILFTGRYPRGIFDYVEGTLRWSSRVQGYAFGLVTDRYPPFSFD